MLLNPNHQSLWRLRGGEFVLLDDSGALDFKQGQTEAFGTQTIGAPERVERLDETPEPYKIGFYRAFSASRSMDGAHFREPERQSRADYSDEASQYFYATGWLAGVAKARELFSQSKLPIVISYREGPVHAPSGTDSVMSQPARANGVLTRN